jgi:hypothetical protein
MLRLNRRIALGLAVLLFWAGNEYGSRPYADTLPQEDKPIIRYVVGPAPAQAVVRVLADVRLSEHWLYLKDFGQLRTIRCLVDDAEITLSSEKIRDILVFTGPPHEGNARFEYAMDVVTQPRPGYRKRLMGNADFLLAREGLFLGMDQAETRPVEVLWELPDGWSLAWSRPSRIPFHETQKRLWVAGRIAVAEEFAVGDNRLQYALFQGAVRVSPPALRAALEGLLNRMGREAGPLPSAELGIAVLPRGSLGGGTALGFDLAAEDSLATIIHEALHWWSNPHAPTWFREGVHSYLAIKLMALSGAITAEEFRAGIQEFYLEHQRVLKREGRLLSLADSEREYNRGTGGGDIYGLMPLLAFKLDREIQAHAPDIGLEDIFAEVCRRPHQSIDILGRIRERTGWDPASLFEAYFKAPVEDAGVLMK